VTTALIIVLVSLYLVLVFLTERLLEAAWLFDFDVERADRTFFYALSVLSPITTAWAILIYFLNKPRSGKVVRYRKG